MNANNFSLKGYVAADAKVNNFEKASVARFGIIVKTFDKQDKDKEPETAIQTVETWAKAENATGLKDIRKGAFVSVSGFFKAESYEKDGKKHAIVKLVATSVEVSPRKTKDENKTDSATN